MKLFIAVLLLSAGFIPADFHPIDGLISSELTDLTESSNEISETSLEDKEKTYDGDLVIVAVENVGNLSEHIGFQVYLPGQADLLQFKSESSGPKGNPKNEMKAKSSPLENADNDEEVNVYEMQTASTRSKLKSGNEIEYSFNYKAESAESKRTNQFLAILDVFSDNPETIKIKFSSANFGFGAYPEGSKHRWLVRTRAGYSLSIDVKEVDLEKDLDVLTVYDVRSSGENEVLSEVSVAKQLDTFSNRVLAVFKSDCSVNRGGFSAVVSVAKNKQKIPACEAPEDLENGYFVVSNGDAIEKAYVTYYCNENYAMVGDVTTLKCSGGSLVPSLLDSGIRCAPECEKPPSLNVSRASVRTEWVSDEGLYLQGTKVHYTCSDGFLMSPPGFDGIVCDETGSWVTPELEFSGDYLCIRNLDLRVRASSFTVTQAEAGEYKQKTRCEISVNGGESLCQGRGNRGFNVAILSPFEENFASKYAFFDTYTTSGDASVRAQLGAMSEYIRKNARDFEVVILGVVDAIDIKDYTANQKDEVNYLVDYLGALRDQCTGFTFYGGRQSYALVSHKRPENGLYAKWTRCTNLAADVPPYSSIQELNFKPIETCGNPKDIEHGRWTPSSSVELWDEHRGSIAVVQQAQYSCDPGYKIEEGSVSYVNCDHNTNSFTPDPPSCVHIV